MGGKQSSDKQVLIGKETLIVLNSEKGRTLNLTHILRFPHGFDGLRIWESGIVLARYAILHRDFFDGKFVLELGSGTGIAGLAVLKFTSCKNCLLSDYITEVVENARRNCQQNNMRKAVVMKLNWKDYESYNNRYDIIIGSDIVAPGAPTKDIYHLLEKFLVPGGSALFVGPKKAGYIEQLLRYVDSKVFDVESLDLVGENYLESPMPNKLEGFECFPGLTTETYVLHTLHKKPDLQVIPLNGDGVGSQLRQSQAEPALSHYQRERVITQVITPIKNSVTAPEATQAPKAQAAPMEPPKPAQEKAKTIEIEKSESIQSSSASKTTEPPSKSVGEPTPIDASPKALEKQEQVPATSSPAVERASKQNDAANQNETGHNEISNVIQQSKNTEDEKIPTETEQPENTAELSIPAITDEAKNQTTENNPIVQSAEQPKQLVQSEPPVSAPVPGAQQVAPEEDTEYKDQEKNETIQKQTSIPHNNTHAEPAPKSQPHQQSEEQVKQTEQPVNEEPANDQQVEKRSEKESSEDPSAQPEGPVDNQSAPAETQQKD